LKNGVTPAFHLDIHDTPQHHTNETGDFRSTCLIPPKRRGEMERGCINETGQTPTFEIKNRESGIAVQ